MYRVASVREIAEERAPASGAPARARLRRLALSDFRCFERLEAAFDGRSVALCGPNGSGKTNMLEAISLFGAGRGLRGARLDELPRIGGAGGWAASLRMAEGSDETMLGVGAAAFAINRRVCRIDGLCSGPASFADRLRLLWLTPAQDRLFMDKAGERRRFFDRMAAARDPTHGAAAREFDSAMRQRQRLLDERRDDDCWLSALEMQMAETGVAVAAARRELAGALAASNIAGDGAVFPAADIALSGELEAALARAPAAAVEESYAARLRSGRRADAEAGRALSGPHRGDIIVSCRATGRPTRLCSTGEQKALLIGLILANARSLSRDGRNAPLILLLDEVAAHLDEARRLALFDMLDELGFQSFLTGADETLFSAWRGRAQLFRIANGEIAER